MNIKGTSITWDLGRDYTKKWRCDKCGKEKTEIYNPNGITCGKLNKNNERCNSFIYTFRNVVSNVWENKNVNVALESYSRSLNDFPPLITSQLSVAK